MFLHDFSPFQIDITHPLIFANMSLHVQVSPIARQHEQTIEEYLAKVSALGKSLAAEGASRELPSFALVRSKLLEFLQV